MIYLDNAATSVMRPQCVVDAVCQALTSLGNPGRGATSESLDAGRVVWECREKVAALLGCPRADHVCFAANATAALNAAIHGLVRPGARVVTTVTEHNSVLRPLNRLARDAGVSVSHAGVDARGVLDYDDLRRLCAGGADVVIASHASNVTGNVADLWRIASIAHEAGALLVVDASQSAGCVPIDMASMGLDVVCFTGHKGLMGPQGTGGLAVAGGIDVRPWNMGGTGVSSFEPLQPE
ncbi:MAG: aminotransferase class V-fold PLP-dependent enzyme, partial [Paratractidigestivibacter faecalis]|uniref:aminotransferase class V-fold PLP-dependent enzyme n=1 Tax=Paratractidigestivibacter faecalis TaxID=2292441 RepID=UPI0026EEE2A4